MVTWHRAWAAVLIAAGCLLGTVASSAGDKRPADETADLAERFREWLAGYGAHIRSRPGYPG